MNKLELKHIAPYLPHVIECVSDDGFRGVLMQLALKEIDFDFQLKIANGNNYQWRYLEGVKPILRPIIDLTKEIIHDEEKLVPSIWIHDNWIGRYDKDVKTLLRFKTYQHLPYALSEKLLEWHFDIYGLISHGLAIDINTLNEGK